MKKWILAFLVVMAFIACNEDKNTDDKAVVESMVTVPVSEDEQWTYFSFKKGEAVGYSAFDSEEEDRQWAARSDWDIAFCGEYMKTNGGTSGSGQGGVIYQEGISYDEVAEAPASGYSIDSEKPVH